jgi:hypothetical protein
MHLKGKFRARQKRAEMTTNRATPDDVRAACELYRAGKTIAQIAQALGISRRTAFRYTKVARLQPPPAPRWFAPNGQTLGKWMRVHRIVVPYRVVVGRLRLGWSFWNAVYTAHRPYADRGPQVSEQMVLGLLLPAEEVESA